MEIKQFKNTNDLENYIKKLHIKTFYKILDTRKKMLKTLIEVLIFNENDIKNYLIEKWQDLLSFFGIKDYDEKINFSENKFYIKINCESQNGELIGHKGHTISALQNLLVSYLESKFNKWYQVTINVNNYLNDQKFQLKKQIYQALKTIKKNNEEIFHFEPMPNNQRKIIHELVKTIDGISSYSEGTGYNRHIVIKLEELKVT